jgi:predicted ABC-type ATPase
MLAGPNGSGKSFLVPSLEKEVNLGVIVNADELEAKLNV